MESLGHFYTVYQFVSRILEIVAPGVLAITRIFRIITRLATPNNLSDLPNLNLFLVFPVPTDCARERDYI